MDLNIKMLYPVLCGLLLWNGAGYAQSGAVALAAEAFKQALVDRDQQALEELTARELSYGHSGGKVEDKKAFIEAVVNGPFQFLTITAEDQSIAVTGNTAIVRHVFVSEARNDNKPVQVKIGNMMVWQKKEGQWRLIARQAYQL